MQTKYLHKKLKFISNGIDETEYSQVVFERLEKIKHFKALKKQHCSEETIFEVIGIPRSTLYRWKSAYEKEGLIGLENKSRAPAKKREKREIPLLEKLIVQIRRENPLWGKKKVKVILAREYGIQASVSTVGRIITGLIKKGKVKPAFFYFGRLKNKKRRVFDGHAQRWKYGMKATIPGELVQFDHATIEVAPGRFVRQFDATCPITKITVSQVYVRATSNIAAQFLRYAQGLFPFPLRSIQVDGGSEFMSDFEQSCKKEGVELFVLPPRSPEYNGNVERRHGTIKYEFYSTYDGSANLEEIRRELARFIQKYNHFRPHESLNFDTPFGYYQNMEAKSHMS